MLNHQLSASTRIALIIGGLSGLLPTIGFLVSLRTSGVWKNYVSALQGTYVNRLTGQPVHAGGEFLWLPVFVAINLGMVWLAQWLAVDRRGGLTGTLRLLASIAVILIRMIVLCVTIFLASLGVVGYGDFKLGMPGIVPPSFIAVTAILVAVVDLVLLYFSNRQSRRIVEVGYS